MMVRPSVPLACLAVVLLTLGAGCQRPAGSGAASREMIAIGTTKADLLGIPAEFRALHVGLESALGRPVWFNSQGNAASIQLQLDQGNIPYAIVSAGEYAAMADTSKLTLLAAGVNKLGQTTRKALIVCRASDTRFQAISDCQGKRFAFGTYGDALTDWATREALQQNGVPLSKLLPELIPPPWAMEGRLYVQNDAASKIVLDITVNAGVIDELVFESLPATGGNPITGPSKDQFRVLGQTTAVPELVVVAGPAADAAITKLLQTYLLQGVKGDPAVCAQLKLIGFAPADRAAYEAVRSAAPPSRK